MATNIGYLSNCHSSNAVKVDYDFIPEATHIFQIAGRMSRDSCATGCQMQRVPVRARQGWRPNLSAYTIPLVWRDHDERRGTRGGRTGVALKRDLILDFPRPRVLSAEVIQQFVCRKRTEPNRRRRIRFESADRLRLHRNRAFPLRKLPRIRLWVIGKPMPTFTYLYVSGQSQLDQSNRLRARILHDRNQIEIFGAAIPPLVQIPPGETFVLGRPGWVA